MCCSKSSGAVMTFIAGMTRKRKGRIVPIYLVVAVAVSIYVAVSYFNKQPEGSETAVKELFNNASEHGGEPLFNSPDVLFNSPVSTNASTELASTKVQDEDQTLVSTMASSIAKNLSTLNFMQDTNPDSEADKSTDSDAAATADFSSNSVLQSTPSPTSEAASSSSVCSDVPLPDYNNWTTAAPSALPRSIKIILPPSADGLLILETGQELCIRVLVTSVPSEEALLYQEPHHPDSPPSSLLVRLSAAEQVLVVPMRLSPWNIQIPNSLLYEGHVPVLDPGAYTAMVCLEWVDYQWALYHTPFPPYAPLCESSKEGQITVSASASYQSLGLDPETRKPCIGGMNHRARWVPEMGIPPHVANDSWLQLRDAKGQAWLSPDCRFKHYTPKKFRSCLKQKGIRTIHWYGDSNSRRSLKSLVMEGSWCTDPNMQHTCWCEDFYEPAIAIEEIDRVTLGNTTIFWRFFEGVTNTKMDWREELFQEDSGDGPPDMVILSIGNWDSAFLPWDVFSARFPELLEALDNLYLKKGVQHFVWRTAQFWCCTVDPRGYTPNLVMEVGDRSSYSYSTEKVASFEKYAQELFVQRFGAKVWNTRDLSEGYSWETLQNHFENCVNGHANPRIVDMENQLLMNLLCNE